MDPSVVFAATPATLHATILCDAGAAPDSKALPDVLAVDRLKVVDSEVVTVAILKADREIGPLSVVHCLYDFVSEQLLAVNTNDDVFVRVQPSNLVTDADAVAVSNPPLERPSLWIVCEKLA